MGAAYRARDLRSWWTLLSRELEMTARALAQRREVEELLRCESRPVLTVPWDQSEGVLLRIRLVGDAVCVEREGRQL